MLVHVMAALAAFTLVSALVVDYGLQLVSRHQIQSTADAAALAGATALAFDGYANPPDGGPAETTARAVATANRIWGLAPVEASVDVSFPACPDSFDAGPSAPPILACVQVDVYRNAARGNPLPTIFGQWFGTDGADVAASATAEAKDANATDCLKPLAIPDRWVERYPPAGPAWSSDSTFDKWDPLNTSVTLSPPDSYTPPSALAEGSGLTVTLAFGSADAGVPPLGPVVLAPGTTGSPVSIIKPWRYLAVAIPGSAQGPGLQANLAHCAKAVVEVGDRLDLQPTVAADITAGLQYLIDLDAGAHWNAETLRVEGSCAEVWPRCASLSPRVIALPVYDLHDLADASRNPGGPTSILVRNFVGFFIESLSGSDVTGYLTMHPGLRRSTAITLTDIASFLRASFLVN